MHSTRLPDIPASAVCQVRILASAADWHVAPPGREIACPMRYGAFQNRRRRVSGIDRAREAEVMAVVMLNNPYVMM